MGLVIHADATLAGAQSISSRSDSEETTYPSRFGKLTSRRWAYGMTYQRSNLNPVENPNPAPEPQPRRDHPFDVVVSKDGRKAYITLLGSELEPGSEVAVYDVAAEKIVGRILLKPRMEVGPPALGPYRMALHPGGRFLVVTNLFSNFASVIDTRTDVVVSEIPLDFYCQGIEFDETGRTGYVANRYLDQVFVVDIRSEGDSFEAAMREMRGLDDDAFFRNGETEGIHSVLVRRCATCHSESEGGYYAGPDAKESFASALEHVTLGASTRSPLLRAVTRVRDGGYADRKPQFRTHGGEVVFTDPERDPDFRVLADWIDESSVGPGIPVGNPRSKPNSLVRSTDGRYVFVANTGTQDISIVSTRLDREVGAIYIQNAVEGMRIYHSPSNRHDYLLVATRGLGLGVPKERDPYGGETWDAENVAAQFSVLRDTETGQILSRSSQKILGPFDAVDGTAETGFRDMQNDIVFIDIGEIDIPESPPAQGPSYLLMANRYEAHRKWGRYTSDTAESTHGDIKGDIPPDLMRVVGSMPEKMEIIGDRLFVTMQASHEVQEWKIDPTAAEPSDFLTPVANYDTGLQPIAIAAGPDGTPAGGKLFVTNFLGGTLTVIDRTSAKTRERVVDPSVLIRPVPDTNAERGELFVRSAAFSSDGDTSCFHCHRLDTNDGRAWGTHQVLGQEYLSNQGNEARRIVGATMGIPQLRGLYDIQPLYYEGTFTAFEQPLEALLEQALIHDYLRPSPTGDHTDLQAHARAETADIPINDIPAEIRSTLSERRDEMFRRASMRFFGKSFTLRDAVRFAGEWQMNEPRLLPNPFDPTNRSVVRGSVLFEDLQVGCVTCHPPPNFAKKDFSGRPEQAFEPTVMFTARDGSSTLVGPYRLDAVNGKKRDLEPWDMGRAEETQGHFTSFQLRGIWDRPPVFLHNGIARNMREVVATPGHAGLRRFKYEPLVGGVPERPGRREVGFNETFVFKSSTPQVKSHIASGARIGHDTHGGTSHLTARQIQDLVDFLNSIE
jgi:DNA-binding beta-propeller fold protein YncE